MKYKYTTVKAARTLRALNTFDNFLTYEAAGDAAREAFIAQFPSCDVGLRGNIDWYAVARAAVLAHEGK